MDKIQGKPPQAAPAPQPQYAQQPVMQPQYAQQPQFVRPPPPSQPQFAQQPQYPPQQPQYIPQQPQYAPPPPQYAPQQPQYAPQPPQYAPQQPQYRPPAFAPQQPAYRPTYSPPPAPPAPPTSQYPPPSNFPMNNDSRGQYSYQNDALLASLTGWSIQDIERLRHEFTAYANSNGVIDRIAFMKLYVASLLNMSWEVLESKAEAAFRNFDVNQTGSLDFNEFVTACSRMTRDVNAAHGNAPYSY